MWSGMSERIKLKKEQAEVEKQKKLFIFFSDNWQEGSLKIVFEEGYLFLIILSQVCATDVCFDICSFS